jgi:nucleolar MIF4G domain-containing protein 1
MGKFRGKHAPRKQQSNVQRLGRAIHRLLQSETGVDFVGKGRGKVMTRKERRKFMRSQKKDHRRTHKRGPLHTSETRTDVDKGHHKSPVPSLHLPPSNAVSTEKEAVTNHGQASKKRRSDVDDREIRRLEKLLKLNKRKKKDTLPATFKAEGLDYVLAVTDPNNKDWSEEEDEDAMWLKSKRDKHVRKQSSEENLSVSESSDISGQESSNEEDDVDQNSGSDGYIDSGDEMDIEDDGFDDLIDDGDDNALFDDGTNQQTVKEVESSSGEEYNEEEQDVMDQLAALKGIQKRTVTSSKSVGEDKVRKYIPPPKMHKMAQEEGREVSKELKRKVKGLINRLSEPNLPSLLSQMEQLYTQNSRNEMNTALSDALFQACVPPTLLPSKFALEHMALVAALTAKVGSEVGAHILQYLAVKLDSYLHLEGYGPGKEADNILQLIAHLYNFKVVHCLLVYDIIKRLIESFAERDIELLLLLLKNVGMAIRKDDPSSLKDIVIQIQSKASKHTIDSSRMKFMLETISALRTNNARKIPNYDPSNVEHMLKVLRGLLPPGSLSESTLKISFSDLLNAKERGRWWIVGSAWTGKETNNTGSSKVVPGASESDSWILDLARKQRMNTDLRKSVFSIIVTSEDYIDAFEKLQRLGLKEVQEREIIHVLVDCCLREKAFNPYYAYLGQKLCEFKRSNQVTFQYTIWDRLKTLSSLPRSSMDNLWKLLSHLVSSKALSLGVLRVVEFSEMDKVGLYFFRKLLTSILCDYSEDVCV